MMMIAMKASGRPASRMALTRLMPTSPIQFDLFSRFIVAYPVFVPGS